MRNAVCHLQNQVRALLETGGNRFRLSRRTGSRRNTSPCPRRSGPTSILSWTACSGCTPPSGMMDYMAGQYSISQIDTPLSGTALAFSDQRDFLAVCVEFQPSQAVQTILSLENELIERIMSEQMEEQETAAADRIKW